MSSTYDYYERGTYTRRRRGIWGHWVPLVLTLTVATVGVVAWVWSQRQSDEHEEPDPLYEDLDYENADYGDNPAYGATGSRGDNDAVSARSPSYGAGELRPGEVGYGTTTATTTTTPRTMTQAQVDPTAGSAASGWGAQMSGALRRTPSPQQFLDSARKTVAAGVSAASIAVGSALAAIREEDKTAYADHETWSEEADAKKDPRSPRRRRRTVAIVVSADAHIDGESDHTSVLSYIPRRNDFSAIKLFILIYAPGLKDTGLDTTGNLPPPSLSSSFSNIEHNQAQTPQDEPRSPPLAAAGDPAFSTVYSQALALVEKESMVLPFTTPNGHTHILRHLQPEVVYLQESLAGENGNVITQLQTWLRHDVVLVVSAESGHDGLADSEEEAGRRSKAEKEKWWLREDRVGRGRGVAVVDSIEVNDDWVRRVQGKD